MTRSDITIDRETIQLLQQETPDFISPDLCPPNSPVNYRISGLMQERVYNGWVPFPCNSFSRAAFPRSAIPRNSYPHNSFPRSSILRNPRIRSFPTSKAPRLPFPLLPGDLPQRTAYEISRSVFVSPTHVQTPVRDNSRYDQRLESAHH